MPNPSVLGILVAHASSSWLEETLDSVTALDYEPLEVLIVACGEVRIPDRVRAGRVREVLLLPANTGYAEAVRQGLAHAGGSEPFVLLLHDDVAPDPDALRMLVERAQSDDGIAAVGAKLLEWEQPEVLQEVGGSIDRFARRRAGLEEDEVDHGQHDDADDVLFCSSAFLLVRRRSLEAVGGLDAEAWPLYDDVDLCWRLRASGWRVVVAPGARVRHAAGLSRGLRRAAGRQFGAVGIRTFAERGRLRFMLKNYDRLSLAAVLPQYFLVSLAQLLSGIVRREFWRLRVLFGGVLGAIGELPRIMDLRRSRPAEVDDQELLRLAARRAVAERRYERTALAGRAYETWRSTEERLIALARSPVVWAAAAALIVYVLVLRGVLFGGAFTLGELRRPLRLGDALAAYTARPQLEGLDLYGPGTPGLVIFGLLRSLAFGSAALAEKLALLLPLPLAAFGARRFGRLLGLAETGRGWLAVVAMVNPVTLALAREGYVGALVTWGAAWWVASVLLSPPSGAEESRDRIRRRARWALGWIAVVALHPPALVWFVALAAAIAVARRGDGADRRRMWLIVSGVGGAFVAGLPWSLQWFGPRTPLVGRHGGYLAGSTEGLASMTFGAGWPLLAWVVVAVVVVAVAGASRTTVVLTALLGLFWALGAAGWFPAHATLVASGWCVLALFVFAVRRVSDQLPRYELGWRQALVVGAVVAVGVGWAGAALGSIAAGTREYEAVVEPAATEDVGRVLWVAPSADGVLAWTTDGFRSTLGSFPIPKGPGQQLVLGALSAIREDNTHRAGALLALADVSHVVAITSDARTGLARQADLSEVELQADAVVYRNEAWLGGAMLLAEAPADVLTPQGLAGLAGERDRVAVSATEGATLRLQPPDDSEGVLYVSGGARGGWTIGGQRAEPAAAGAWVRADGLGETLTADPPADWIRWFYPLQALLLTALIVVWAAAVYLAGPESERARQWVPVDLRAPVLPAPVVWAPVVLIIVAGWLGWAQPVGAVPGRFLSAAWYCPPAGEGFGERLAIVNPAEEPVDFLLRPSVFADPQESGRIGPRGRSTLTTDPERGSVVESYGRRVAVASIVSRERTATSLCATSPSGAYRFPEGGRGALRARPRLFETYVLYNPFSDLARASIRFVRVEEGEDGEEVTAISPPALQDVRVPPGEAVLVDPESQFFFPVDLSTTATVWQGRAIVARRLRTTEDLSWSLGVQPVSSGIVPRASTAGAVTELVAFNPHDDPVRLSLQMTGGAGSIPPVDRTIEARGRLALDLNGVAPEEEELLVRVTASEPIPIESLVVPDERRLASLLPLLDPAQTWVAPVAEGTTLFIANPQTVPVRLTFIPLGPGPRIAPRTIGASRMLALPLQGEGAFGLVVRATGGVTAAVAGAEGSAPALPS